VATALGVLLSRAGHEIVAASGHEASAARVANHLPGTRFETNGAAAASTAETIVIGVPDDVIRQSCEAIASAGAVGAGRRVLHLSGAAPLDTLAAARDVGAGILSLHPLQSFPDVETGIERLPGSGVAVTAEREEDEAFGMSLARDAGGRPFPLRDEVKPLYHSAAVFAANYLVTVEGLAERVLRASGVEDPLPLLEPLARTSFDRAFALGPGDALTGPVVRADVGTIGRNLAALAAAAPDLVRAYAALAAAAAAVAFEADRIDAEQRRSIEEALEPWR
jgi:predicted short-subunit dehydrogenase-like oxidoreductase (DUF2520 family)